jgi:site-specific DNA-cytosine methylase
MSIEAVDLFAGFGGLTLGSEQAGVPVVWAGNHWQTAVDTHARNHPRTVHACQDLRQTDWSTLPPYRLLLSAPACFGPDTTVTTARGVIFIPDVVVGDLVLTHLGRWRPVTATMSRRAETVKLGLTETTEDHRYYSRDQSRRWNQPTRQSLWSLGEPDWTPVRALLGKFVAVPVDVEAAPVPDFATTLTVPDWYMVGRWLGDGWVRHVELLETPSRARNKKRSGPSPCLNCGAPALAMVCNPLLSADFCSRNCGSAYGKRHRRPGRFELTICTGHADAGALEAALARTDRTWHRRTTRTGVRYTTAGRELVEFFSSAFSHGAAGKTIPGWLLGLDEEKRTAILTGYMDADGSPTRNGHKSTTVSKRLAVGLRLLASSLGFTANVSQTACKPTRLIEGRLVHQQPFQYTVGVVGGVGERYTKLENGLRWMKQRKSPEPGRVDVEVYDLTVDEDHSFVADGFVVHNCQGHSPASQPKRRAYHDAVRATAVAVIDCADVTNPDAIIVENVPAFTRWRLYPWWREGLERLGYQLDTRIVTASTLGVAQRRTRLFIIATRPGVNVRPLRRDAVEPAFGRHLHRSVDEQVWRSVSAATPAVRERIEHGRANHGHRFLTQHVTGHPGVGLNEPIRTITTASQHWNLVDGDRYRALSTRELARGMGFPDTYTWDQGLSVADVTKGLGNSVCPPVGREVVSAVAEAIG